MQIISTIQAGDPTRAKALADAPDHVGRTALHIAASVGDVELMDFLVSRCGANLEAKTLVRSPMVPIM